MNVPCALVPFLVLAGLAGSPLPATNSPQDEDGVSAADALRHADAEQASRKARKLEENGDIEGARHAYAHCVTILGEGPYPDPVAAQRFLTHAARFHWVLGEFRQAEPLLERARTVTEESPYSLGVIDILLTTVYFETGRYAKARRVCDRGAATAVEAKHRLLQWDMALASANLEFKLGNLDEAERGLWALLEEYEQYTSDTPAHTVHALTTLGLIPLVREDYEEASRIGEEALAHAESLDDPLPGMRVLVNLGEVAVRMHQLDLARGRFERALELAKLHDRKLIWASALDGLANVALEEDQPEAAADLAAESLEMFRAHDWLEHALFPLRTSALAALAREDAEGAAQAVAEAEALLDRPEVRGLSAPDAAGVRSRFAEFAEITQDIVDLRCRQAAPEAETEDLLREGFESESRWKGRTLREGMGRGDVDEPEVLDSAWIEDLQSGLDEKQALIEYAGGYEQLYAYRLDAAGLRRFDLGKRDEILDLADAFVTILAEPGRGSSSGLLRLGQKLHDRLLAPVLAADGPSAVDRLLIVPNLDLSRLPFDALVIEPPPTTETALTHAVFVIDRYTVSLAPASPVLARRPAPRSSPGSGRAILLGDPILEAPLATSRGEISLPRVKESRREVIDVARTLLRADPRDTDASRIREDLDDLWFSAERSSSLQNAVFELHLGCEATPARLLGNLRDVRLVHIAAHGLVDLQDPRFTGIALTSTAEEEDRLTLDQARSLELDADLVVLSACDTARGHPLRGEGVQSMAYAFLDAGARSVVASLWQVRDVETQTVMIDFYRHLLLDGDPAPSALRRAKLAVRHSRELRGVVVEGQSPPIRESAHPYHWAPFVYIGPD